MEEKVTDAMALITGTGKTATAVIDGREQRRAENDGFLVAPPCPLSDLADARLEEEPGHGETRRRPNAALRMVQAWLWDIFDAGGDTKDLRKAWTAWQSPHRSHVGKSVIANEYEGLLRRANLRELELADKAGRETGPERVLAAVRAQLGILEHRVARLRAELAAARANLTRAEEITGSSREGTMNWQVRFAAEEERSAAAALAAAERQLKAAQERTT